MSDVENLIVKYAKLYENKLKKQNYSHNEIEKMVNEWIKNALNLCKDNPNLTVIDFENILNNEDIILK